MLIASASTAAVAASPSPVFESLSVSDAALAETTSVESEVEIVENSNVFETENVDFPAIPDMFEVA